MGRNVRVLESHAALAVETVKPVADVPAEGSLEAEIPFPTLHDGEAKVTTPGRPRKVSRHRRSIRDLSSEYDSGLALQQYLQASFTRRLFSLFFTVHARTQDAPVYVSEVLEETANPQFRELDLARDFAVGEETCCVITLWGKSQIDTEYAVITSECVVLADLQFLGSSITAIDRNLAPNSLLVVLRDGYYALPKLAAALEQKEDDEALPATPTSPNSLEEYHLDTPESTQLSLSFDAIMKLNNLQACSVDTTNTELEADKQIGEFLSTRNNLFMMRKQSNDLRHRLARTREYKRQQGSRAAATARRIQQLRQDIKACTDAIAAGEARQRAIRRASFEMHGVMETDKIVISSQQEAMRVERARIVRDLGAIFPLAPTPNALLRFTICGLPLPRAGGSVGDDDGDDDSVGAAYGYAAQLVLMLSYYLGVTLRYPIQPFGSQSFIIDPISAIQGSRTFPLWTKGSLFFRFQYATFLFNKDVEQVLNAQGVKIADVRQVLANLKNLILVLS